MLEYLRKKNMVANILKHYMNAPKKKKTAQKP